MINNDKLFIRSKYAQKLINGRDFFLQKKNIEPEEEPLEPFMRVTDDILCVREHRYNIRSVYIIPFVIAFWIILIYAVSNIGLNSNNISYAKEKLIEYEEMKKSGIYFDEFDTNSLNYFKGLFGENKKYSIINYLKTVYLYANEGHREAVKNNLITIAIISIFTFYLTLFFIKSPRPADIYFDRRRKIVYTWVLGRLAACRFENLGFLEKSTGVVLYLYGDKRNDHGNYDLIRMKVQPTGGVFLNSEEGNNYFLQQIFNFMEFGKSSLITGDSFNRNQPKTYFFTDKKPEPFEERLKDILEHEHILPKLYRNLKE
ncbi:hypothetical protein BS333_17300 [Vibrio azureus]|uniref:Uncharacterized protein n=2 Tax=Vibrio azureus TaxID=512649 RepID=U3AMJ2_9VIBR|nr:hypothetical protein [Vibrio azureus]AUI88118.1 hypothetical protein BS333_17300 [Vibrio azureus]GAD74990.1 hypothetical protein VAZ01S_017_00860 [Vibrio azureus NBRC 104587]